MKQKLLVLLSFLKNSAEWQYGKCTTNGSSVLSTSDSNSNTDEKCFDACRSHIVAQSDPWSSSWCCEKDQSQNKCYLWQWQHFQPNQGGTAWKGQVITQTDTTFTGTSSTDCSSVIDNVSSPQAYTTTLFYGSTSPQNIYPSSSSTDWNEIFGNSESTDCPITACQLRARLSSGSCSGSSEPYFDTSNSLAMDSTNLIVQATIASSGSSDLDDEICVECETATSGFKQWYTWTVEFKQSSCDNTLTAKDWSATYIQHYELCFQEDQNEANYLRINPNGLSDFFTIGANCNVQQCNLYRDDCQNAVLSNSGRANMRLNTDTSDWFLEIDLQTSYWMREFCLSCTLDGTNYVEFKPKITISPNLITNMNPLTAWDTCASQTATTSIQTAISWYTDLFTADAAWACTPEECTLYESDCQTLFTDNTKIQLDGPRNYKVQYFRNVAFDLTICVKCSYKAFGYDPLHMDPSGTPSTIQETSAFQTYRIYVPAIAPDCTGAISQKAGTPSYLSSVVSYDSSEGDHVSIMTPLANAGFVSWNHHFDNTQAPCCKITQCSLEYRTDTASSWATATDSNLVYMFNNQQIRVKKNVLAGYTYYLKLICTYDGSRTIEDDRWVVQQTSGCATVTCDANSLQDYNFATGGAASFISSQVAYNAGTRVDIISSISSFVSMHNLLADSPQVTSCCAITSCLAYGACAGVDCYESQPWTDDGGANPGPVFTEFDSASNQFKIKAKYAVSDYSVNYKITCSTAEATAHITGLSATQIPIDCTNTLPSSNPGSALANVTFYYDASATSDHHVSAQFSSIYDSGTDTSNWNLHFNNQKVDDCPITSCLLQDQSGYTLTSGNSPVWLDSATGNIFAKHQAGGTYHQNYKIQCQNSGGIQVDDRLWVIQKINCAGTLSAASTPSPVTYQYQDGIQKTVASGGDGQWYETVVPSGYSSNLDWTTFFGNLEPTNCPVECSLYQQGCSSPFGLSDDIHYDSVNNKIKIKTSSNAQFSEKICVECTTIQGENDQANLDTVSMDNWQVTVNNCLTTKIVPSFQAQEINLYYTPGAPDEMIYPDSQNKTLQEYFNSNQNCPLQACVLVVAGTSNNAVPTQLTGNSMISIDSSNNFAVSASKSISQGYTIDFGVCCRSPNAVSWGGLINGGFMCFDNWKVNLHVYVCSMQQVEQSTFYLDIGESKTLTLSSLVEITGADKSQSECQTLQGSLSTSNNGFQLSDQTITIDTSTPSQNVSSTVVTITNQISNSAWISLSFFVCGSETLNLTSPDALVKTFNMNSGTNFQDKIELTEYAPRFMSSVEGCNIVSFRLIDQLTSGEIVDLQDDDISMGPNFEILVSTDQELSKTVSVQASTKNSNKTAVLQLIVYVTNFAPYFKEGPPQQQSFQLGEQSSSFHFAIPEAVDQEELSGSSITFTVLNLNSTFMVYDEALNEIHFVNITNDTAGNYTVQVVLEDSIGKKAAYDLKFEILPELPESEDTEETRKQESKATQYEQEIQSTFERINPVEVKTDIDFEFEVENKEICKATIKKLNYFGQTTIYFSQKMRHDFDLSQIDEKVLEIYVEPALGRHLDDPTFDNSSLDLTWVPHSFDEQNLIINVTFKNAKAISPLEVQDQLVVKFLNKTWPIDPRLEVIYAKEIDKTVDDAYRVIKKAIQRQLEDSESNRNFAASSEMGTDTIKAYMVFSFLLNMIMAGALGYMIGWINTLQLIIHLPMLRILVPANVGMFFQTIIPIVTFDIIPPEWSTEFFLEFEEFPQETFKDKFDSKIFGQMQDLGYDSHNSIQILGSLWVFSVFYFMRLIFLLPLVSVLSRCFKKLVTYKQDLQQKLIIGEWVPISLEAYLEFLIAGYLNIQYSLKNETGEKAGYFTSFYSLGVAVVILPALMIYVLWQPISKIQDESFIQKYGSLYEGIKLDSKWKICANLIFMIRRSAFILVCLNMDKLPGVQIITVNLINLGSCLYYGGIQPLTPGSEGGLTFSMNSASWLSRGI